MRWQIAVCAGGLWLAACEAAPDAREAVPAPGAEHVIDPLTGETRITLPAEDGLATLRAGPNVPLLLPEGFTLFPGARVVTNARVTRPGRASTLVTFEADAPAAAVIAHTRAEAATAGFAIAVDLDTEGTGTIAATRRVDGATLSLTATQGEPTTGQLAIAAPQG